MTTILRISGAIARLGGGIARYVQSCIDTCCGDPPTYYCCWNDPNDPTYGSFCQQGECSEGAYRSGPYYTAEQCAEACDDPPPAGYYCCRDPQNYSAVWASCQETPCDPGYYVSGPHATLQDCEAVCPDPTYSGACCPPSTASDQSCFIATQAECSAIGGDFFLGQTCAETPCPGDCFDGSYPSPCGGSPVVPPNCYIGQANCYQTGSQPPKITVSLSGVARVPDPFNPGQYLSPAIVAQTFNSTTFVFSPCSNVSPVVQVQDSNDTYLLSVNVNLYEEFVNGSPTGYWCVEVRPGVVRVSNNTTSGGEATDCSNTLPDAHTVACYCYTLKNCTLSSSGSLVDSVSQNQGYLAEFANASYNLSIS